MEMMMAQTTYKDLSDQFHGGLQERRNPYIPPRGPASTIQDTLDREEAERYWEERTLDRGLTEGSMALVNPDPADKAEIDRAHARLGQKPPWQAYYGEVAHQMRLAKRQAWGRIVEGTRQGVLKGD
jgi:hypothetical protein